MGDSILRDKSKEFAKNIVFLAQRIKDNKKEFVMTHQLLKSGTSIGANIHEAQYAQSSDSCFCHLYRHHGRSSDHSAFPHVIEEIENCSSQIHAVLIVHAA